MMVSRSSGLITSMSGRAHRGLICDFLVFWLQLPIKAFALIHNSVRDYTCFSNEIKNPYAVRSYACELNKGPICPVSILYKSIAGRYRPVRVADGPITARYRFIKNASWGMQTDHMFVNWVCVRFKCESSRE